MSPNYKEYAFEFDDLRLLSIVCGTCKCEMIIDLSTGRCHIPNTCSACKTDFDEAFKIGLHAFRDAYLNFSNAARPEIAAKARIRIRREIAEF
jgi:hypothetical protein